jgi:restriction system protein
MELSEEQRSARTGSGIPKYRHRAGWAANSLKHAGLVTSPAAGHSRLTELGLRFVREHASGFSAEDAREIQRRAREKMNAASDEGGDSTPAVDSADSESSSPEEQIESGLAAVRAAVATDVLERLSAVEPSFFEQVVLQLLHGMGYGANRSDLHRVGGSGDGGIDGIISLDRLGLEKVYVQAKRWQSNVGRPEIQGFFGALSGRRANKGVFITTSGFTREAREFAASVSDTLVLVNGRQLAELMVEFGIGVSRRVAYIPEIDTDYFSET